jgi:hypothetical protein
MQSLRGRLVACLVLEEESWILCLEGQIYKYHVSVVDCNTNVSKSCHRELGQSDIYESSKN